MKKKILILGAGIYQVPLIERAKEMGYETVVASINGDYPGFRIADSVVYEDISNPEKMLGVAKSENISGVCTAGSDVSVISIGRICDALGLKGVSYEAAKIACDKMLMKRCFEDHNVKTARFRYVNLDASLNEVEKKCEELGYPVIFKAIDSSGSRGITRVDDNEGIANAIQSVKNVTRHDYYIVEEFLIGKEFGAQAFVQNGKVEMVMTHGDYVFVGDTGVPIGHFVPYDNTHLEDSIKEELQKAIYAMGVDNCAINADFILVNDDPYVLEIGARAGATGLSELVSLYYGYDYYEKIIRAAVGETVDFTPGNAVRQPAGSYLLYSEKSGVIKKQENNNVDADYIKRVHFDYSIGKKVSAFKVGSDRIGDILVTGDNFESVESHLKEVINSVDIIVE